MRWKKKIDKSHLKPYPTWVCHTCATTAGGSMPVGHVATWHPDICGVCKATTSVTEPRDYRYPEFAGYAYWATRERRKKT